MIIFKDPIERKYYCIHCEKPERNKKPSVCFICSRKKWNKTEEFEKYYKNVNYIQQRKIDRKIREQIKSGKLQ